MSEPHPARTRQSKGYYKRRKLPHFDDPGRVQMITFRLADSLPRPHLLELKEELGLIRSLNEKTPLGARASRPPKEKPPPGGRASRPPKEKPPLGGRASRPPKDRRAKEAQLRERIEGFLDKGHGACHLRDPRIAQLVQHALLYFDGQRYDILAWVIMPNHVHVIIVTNNQHTLPDIVQSWKSYTSKKAKAILGLSGDFWQDDYFDRFIRNEAHMERAVAYIHNNPVGAGLAAEPQSWPFSSASHWAAADSGAGETPAPPGATSRRHDSGGIARPTRRASHS